MDEAVAERGVAKARGEGRERRWAEAVFPPLARVKGVGRRPRAGEVEGRVVVDVASCWARQRRRRADTERDRCCNSQRLPLLTHGRAAVRAAFNSGYVCG